MYGKSEFYLAFLHLSDHPDLGLTTTPAARPVREGFIQAPILYTPEVSLRSPRGPAIDI
jgi:hypothetical protein